MVDDINKRNRHIITESFQKGFAATGFLYFTLRLIDFFFPNSGLDDIIWFIIIAILSSIYGMWKAFPRSKVVIPIPITNSVVEIRFGDIFKNEGVIIIPVNEYFDHEIGDCVSEDSLHGQFILKTLRSGTKEIGQMVNMSLEEKVSNCGKKKRRRKETI